MQQYQQAPIVVSAAMLRVPNPRRAAAASVNTAANTLRRRGGGAAAAATTSTKNATTTGGRGSAPASLSATQSDTALLRACKCEICICGQHQCSGSQYAQSHYDPDVIRTTHQQDFINHPRHAVHRSDHAPKRVYEKSAYPFDGTTTAKTDFSGAHGKPSTPIRPGHGDDIIGTSAERNFATENRSMFDPKGVAKRHSFKPDPREANTQSFDGTTTNKADFQHWSVKPSTPFHAKNELSGSDETRDFQTEAALKFVHHPLQRVLPFVPAARPPHNATFDGESTSKASYQDWKSAPAAPFRPVSEAFSREETRDFTTESRRQYSLKQAARVQSARPARNYEKNPAPFDGVSTNKAEFPAWQVPPSQPFRPSRDGLDVINPTAERSFSTENRSMFDNKGNVKRKGFKPEPRENNAQPFDGTTTNKADFQQWNVKPSTPFHAKNELSGSDETRDFQTEAALKYVPHAPQRTTPFVPAARPPHNAVFDAQSTSKADYRPYVYEPCPSSNLPESKEKEGVHNIYERGNDQKWHPL